ncbi:MAG: outer membrane protein transport protein [Saprospiraceae bacterium]|nr:outer membrane protein transport protein [Saprospiraceae bacterium]
MKKYILTSFVYTLVTISISAQTVGDVLRYSYLQPGGTARATGAGGAFGALGAEFASLSQNPAGIALFRSNELVVTPSLRFARTESQLEGGLPIDDAKSTFAFDNFGLLFNSNRGKKNWTTVNFGIGVNRQNNFNASIFYEGDAAGTIVNGLYDDALNTINNGGTEADFYPFDTKLAYDAGAIFQDANTGEWVSDFLGNENAVLRRSQAINTFGKMNEMVISLGGNYQEKLMLGATVGVPFVNYRIEGEYVEEDDQQLVEAFDRLTYTEYLRTEGVGVNLKLGLIYKVNQTFRVGATFHTPTALSLTDTYSNTFAYEYTINGQGYGGDAISPDQDGVSDYKLRTPWRATGSLAAVIKKFGFVSADVEVVDYSNNRYNFTADVPSQENEVIERAINREIQQAYKQALNFRFGAELVLDQFRLRGGLNLLGKPQAGEEGYNTAFTAGAGVRGESFYLDLGWRHYSGQGSVLPYAGAPKASTDNVTNDILLTLGFKF